MNDIFCNLPINLSFLQQTTHDTLSGGTVTSGDVVAETRSNYSLQVIMTPDRGLAATAEATGGRRSPPGLPTPHPPEHYNSQH